MVETSTGFKCEVNSAIKTDWNFIKAYQKLQKNPSDLELMENVFIMILTESGFEALKEHIASLNGGLLPMKAMVEEFKEIINNSEIKN